MRSAVALFALAAGLAGCAALSGTFPQQSAPPPVAGGMTIAFEIPEGWTRLSGTSATHYLTTGDPEVCTNVVGSCDPSTYVMERGTMDVLIEPVIDEAGCAEATRPTWDARVEERANQLREATYRLSWTVCFADTGEPMRIAADLRAGELDVRDGLLAELRSFIETVELLRGSGEMPPDGKG